MTPSGRPLLFRDAPVEYSLPYSPEEVRAFCDDRWYQTGGDLRVCRLLATIDFLLELLPDRTLERAPDRRNDTCS